MKKIIIFDFNSGNYSSISNAVEHLGYSVSISNNLKDLTSSKGVILPGNGNLNYVVSYLKKNNLFDLVVDLVKSETSCLGICLGMQIIFENLYEDKFIKGLGVLKGDVNAIQSTKDKNKKIILPHIGWNNVKFKIKSKLFKNIKDESNFYFLHSHTPYNYEDKYVTSLANYEMPIVASLQFLNFTGVQFHPEKSGRNGINFLKNWLDNI